MKKHLNIQVIGKVQGVFYRKNTQEQAKRVGINGWVKNQQDGSVYIEAEGEEMALDEFIKWCWQGPKSAQVTEVKVEEGLFREYKTFDIKRT